MASTGRSGWSTGKILAVVIPICIVVAGAVVALVLVLGKSDSGKQSEGKNEVSQEELVKTYEELNKEAQQAVTDLQELAAQEALATETTTTSTEAASSTAAYEQELEQLNATFAELEQDVEVASAALTEASGEVSETAEDYQQLYDELSAYYAYLEQLTQQAVGQIEYLQSVIPTLEDVEQYKNLVNRMSGATPLVQRDLSAQLTARSQAALSRLQGTTAPASMQDYSAEMNELAGQVNGFSQQISDALASGNTQALGAISNELSSALAMTQQQLSAGLTSAFNSMNSQLASAGQKVNAALP